MARIFVAGATGMLGREVVRLLAASGRDVTVRVLTRDAGRGQALGGVEVHVGDALRADTLRGALDGVDTVFSSLGASVSLKLGAGWRGYRAVDVPANLNLLEAAKQAGVKRFVYVSAHVIPETVKYTYFAAHEHVASAVLGSGMDGRVLRPTAFFSALRPFVDFAKARKKVPVLGDGAPKSNPISDADLAEAAVEMLLAAPGEGPRERSLGGPDVLTRADIARLACEACGVAPRYRFVPAWVARTGSLFLTPISPRLAQLVRFATEVSVRDLIAPQTGTRHLADWFREAAKA
ncbi:MAG: NAD(P)H-binding protein [Myxococcota bacterium]